MAMTLEGAGHEVSQAGSGREGVMLFHAHAADAIITDLVMPDDSLETIVEFCVQRPALPVILISGLAADSPRARGVAQMLGARRLLPKPFRLADLAAAATEVLAVESGRPIAT